LIKTRFKSIIHIVIQNKILFIILYYIVQNIFELNQEIHIENPHIENISNIQNAHTLIYLA